MAAHKKDKVKSSRGFRSDDDIYIKAKQRADREQITISALIECFLDSYGCKEKIKEKKSK